MGMSRRGEDGGRDIIYDGTFGNRFYILEIKHGVVVGVHTAQGSSLEYQAFLQAGFEVIAVVRVDYYIGGIIDIWSEYGILFLKYLFADRVAGLIEFGKFLIISSLTSFNCSDVLLVDIFLPESKK